MPPSIRDLVGDIRDSLEKFPREALVEILTYVFKEYVVEGAAPVSSSQAAVRDELEGLSFAEVIQRLQLRLDLPELTLFEVQGDRVSVKIGGRSLPIDTQASRPDPMPPPAPLAAPAAPLTTAQVTLQPRSAALPAPPPAAAPAAPGMVREEIAVARRPAAAPAQAPNPPPPRPTPPPPSATPSQSAPPSAAKAVEDPHPDKPGRFGLLEID